MYFSYKGQNLLYDSLYHVSGLVHKSQGYFWAKYILNSQC